MGTTTEETRHASIAAMPPEDAMRSLGSRATGLTSEEVTARLRTDGPNLLPLPKRPGAFRRLLAQMTHFFATLLWAAAVLAWIAGLPQLAIAIVVVVIVNGVFSFVQEERAEHATLALRQLLPIASRVFRDGRRSTVEAVGLARGDILELREGDRISADARLLSCDDLRVDESALTGESKPVSKQVAAPAAVEDPLDAPDLAFAGTYVTSGAARAIVFATGTRTRIGQIAGLTQSVVRRPTPLRLDLDRAVRVIAVFALAAGLLFFGASLALGAPATDGFLFAIGVIVALVPEGLLPTLTLSLSISATRMAHRGALVRSLEGVETLGATTIICSDKTGTMTTNQMTARAAWTPARSLTATRTGWTPGGTLLEDDRPLDDAARAELRHLLEAAALCGDARLEAHDGGFRCVGDPTEGALVAFARKGGVEREAAERGLPRVREVPFSSVRRRMTTIHRSAEGSVGYTKGSPETVLECCDRLRNGSEDVELDAERRVAVVAAVDRLAHAGLRVLAFATRTWSDGVEPTSEVEAGLVFLGLIGMEDPVRPEVPGAIDRCTDAGIRVLMITGDHPATAVSVARAVGLAGTRVMLGDELPTSDDALRTVLTDPELSVMARIAPEQKLRIAAAFQAAGEVVAMTGDGVNDAPALRRADIGVAMGATGTDVAREAADLVLLDDDFTHIVEAIEEGRASFDNIRRFLTYHLTDNVAELAPFVVWALSGGVDPAHALRVAGAGTRHRHRSSARACARRRATRTRRDGALTTSPHRTAPVATRVGSRVRVPRACRGGDVPCARAHRSSALLRVGMGEVLPSAGIPKETLSAMVFAAIVAMQMANAFECRSDPSSLVTIGPLSNRLLVGAVGVEFVALLVFIYWPPLANALGGAPLDLEQWGLIALTPIVLLAAEETRKGFARRG